MNDFHLISPKQDKERIKRFIKLCLEQDRQSGQCRVRPFMQLLSLYELEPEAFTNPYPDIYLRECRPLIYASKAPILQAAQNLLEMKTWSRSREIEVNIHVIATEVKKIESAITPLFSAESEGAAILRRLGLLRNLITYKLNEDHFLSPTGLRAEQPITHLEHHRRVKKYLIQLQIKTNELARLFEENE